MKRIGNLYEKIIALDNLRLADAKARRGKERTYGVRHHDKNREENILALHDALLTKTYKTSEYEIFKIHEPKERIIYRLPYYPDRIVHHAIMNILEPIFVKYFTHNTYSCIKDRGIEGCARHTEKTIRKFKGKPLYCLKIDIKKFYPSIEHGVIKAELRLVFKDKKLLWLLDEIIDSADGIPIGNYLSQYLANFILAVFMHFVLERLPRIVAAELGRDAVCIKSEEYADDIVFLSDDKAVLHCVFRHIDRFLSERLRLKIKGNYQVFPIADNRFDKHGRAFDFVGYKFFRKQKLIRKSIKQNMCRAVARLNKRQTPLAPKEYKQRVAPWLGWAKHSNSRHLLQTIIKPMYYESIFRQ